MARLFRQLIPTCRLQSPSSCRRACSPARSSPRSRTGWRCSRPSRRPGSAPSTSSPSTRRNAPRRRRGWCSALSWTKPWITPIVREIILLYSISNAHFTNYKSLMWIGSWNHASLSWICECDIKKTVISRTPGQKSVQLSSWDSNGTLQHTNDQLCFYYSIFAEESYSCVANEISPSSNRWGDQITLFMWVKENCC